MLFAKPPVQCEMINDVDDRIVTLYRVAKSRSDELTALINATPYSESQHRKAREMLQSSDELLRAWAVYVQLKMSYANRFHGGWMRDKQKSCQSKCFANRKERLQEQCDRLRFVQISCCDAIRTIELYDTPHTLHYCDPPYPGTDQGHYKGYTLQNYKTLVAALEACKGSVMLSNYEQPIKMPKRFKKITIETVQSAGSAKTKRKATEILWYSAANT